MSIRMLPIKTGQELARTVATRGAGLLADRARLDNARVVFDEGLVDRPREAGRLADQVAEGEGALAVNLHTLATLAGRFAEQHHDGDRRNCIQASGALRDVLRHLGYPAGVVRVEALVLPRPDDGGGARGVGNRPGSRAKGPDTWAGHLVVIADPTDVDIAILDPTLDQIASCECCPERDRFYKHVRPFAARVPHGRDWSALFFTVGDQGHGTLAEPQTRDQFHVRYRFHPKAGGWDKSPAFSARSRRELADEMLRWIDAHPDELAS